MLYKEYHMEVFKESMGSTKPETKTEVPEKVEPKTLVEITGLIPYKDLPASHPAWKMVLKRKIPESMYSDIYFCKDFFPWASQFNSAFSKVTAKEPRLIIPYRNRNGAVFGFTCRAYAKSDKKYIEIKIDPDVDMIYGLDKINLAKTILCVEGPVDSMFLPNAIAVGGASYHGEFFNKYKNNIVIVPDNDWKRNKDVLNQIEKLAKSGFRVSLMPDTFEFKDINKAIETGAYTAQQITDMIMGSIKEGPELLLEIAFRRKC